MSAPTPEKLSIREFARRDGCDESRVRKAIRTGHLRRSAAGKLDAALVGTGWRETNRRAADTLATQLRTTATVRNLVAGAGNEVSDPPERVTNYPESMAEMAMCAAYNVGLALAGRLSRPGLDDIVDQVATAVRREAVMMLNEEGVRPPPGYPSWSEHPLFSRPALEQADWEDFETRYDILPGEASADA